MSERWLRPVTETAVWLSGDFSRAGPPPSPPWTAGSSSQAGRRCRSPSPAAVPAVPPRRTRRCRWTPSPTPKSASAFTGGYGIEESNRRHEVVSETVANGTATRNGTEPPLTNGTSVAYDGAVYELRYEVVESRPATSSRSPWSRRIPTLTPARSSSTRRSRRSTVGRSRSAGSTGTSWGSSPGSCISTARSPNRHWCPSRSGP